MVSESDVCGPNSSLEFFVDGVVPECFMDVILFALNSAFIFIFGAVRVRQTLKLTSHSIPTTPLYLIRLCTCLAGALVPLIQTLAILVRGDPETFRVIANLYVTASWLVAMFVVIFEYSRALRSNWIVRLWGTSTFMLSGLALQSDVHLKRPGFDIFLSVVFTLASLIFGMMVLFYNQLPAEYEKLGSSKDDNNEGIGMEGVGGHTLLEEDEEEEEEEEGKNKRKPNPLNKANFISRITFQWLNPILRTGYKRPLELTDLFEPPSAYQAATIAKRFSDIWDDLRIQGKQTLFKAFVRLVGRDFFVSGLFKLAQDLLMFAGPVLLNRIVLFVKDPSQPQSVGFVLVGLMFIAAVLQTLFVHQYFYITFCVGMEVRAAVVSAVYRKSFFLSNKARQQSTVGEIVNLQSIDANKFQDLFPYLHMIWSAPLQLIIAMVMLWQLLGPSCLAGVAVMILTVPANGVIAKKLFGVQKIIMSLRDRRIKLMNEILSGMRIIKFFAWEESFINQLNKIRNGELDTLRSTLWIRAISSFLWGATPTLVALCTFALYALLGNNLTAERAFTALALFNIIRFPMNMLPMIVSSVIESRVSLQRLSKFLLAEELDPNAVEVKPNDSNTPIAISIREGSWTWDTSPNPTLEEISLEIPRGKLVAVVGQVGGGKSSLLSAILGEITKLKGQVKLNGSTAYVAQQPWIQNATLRDNILFGTPFDQEKYDRVVQVCELTADINMLPNGDQTEIGEKGINLSGGQKQRLSVARAIYQNKDIYLLDDCLSAVDAHVGKAIFENAIMGELKSKTRVLVTHQLQFVWCADLIVVLKDGKISEMGSYDLLMKNQQEFYQLISTHVKKADESIANNQNAQEESEASNGTPKSPKASDSTPATPSARAPQGKLIQAEEREVGHVDSKVWLAYFAAIGGLFFAFLVLLGAAIEQSISVSASFWLSHWSAALSENAENHTTGYYLGIYAALSLGSTFMVFGRAMMINIAGLNSSRTFHAMMLNTIMRAPMSFFDTTPIGRILNRFSKDVYAIDESLPRTLGMLILMLFASAGIMLSIAYITPIFLIILLPLGYIYRFTQKFYLQSSREIQRLESITKSPVYAQFSETLSGVSTIRPYRRQDDFIAMNNAKVDLNISAYYILNSSNRWLGVRLEFIGTCIVTVAAAFAVIGRSTVDPGLAGLSITSALNLTGMLNWLVRMATETETQMVSVERARQYTQLPQEAPAVIEHNRPPPNWPTEGTVELKDVKLRYREGLDLILKGISVSIKGKEKVGVVGRTGAGKSSLMLALFRLVELAEGHIYIDGLDVSQIGLKDLRTKLSIIPQDPTLYTGTVRSNLDPFDEHTDKEIWDALQNVYLKGNIETLPDKLNAPVSEGGENFSVGQRQLLCLARAILRRAKIMVMDEATAAVDFETDALIQKTIREQFANVTVLTIAHRIHTILDYDKILVLDKGLVAEFDSPNNLLQNPNGIFYSMTHKSGTVEAH